MISAALLLASIGPAQAKQPTPAPSAAAPAATTPTAVTPAAPTTPQPPAAVNPDAAVPTVAPAQPASAPAAPAASSTAQGPYLEMPNQPVQVHSPAYGMNLEKVEQDGYTYKRRQWRDIVRNDPELMALHRRGRLVVSGSILTSIGGAWLIIATAAEIDNHNGQFARDMSATEFIFRWGVPLALLGAGIPLTVIGAKARMELRRRQAAMMATPVATKDYLGVAVGGRF